MSNSSVPFYTQAAILDRYIHSSDPGADPHTLEVILEMLRSREDLRDYFFRSRPHAAWASILWDHGFFDALPSPQEAEGGYVLPRWDVQEYLISVANQVPEIVVKHVETIQGHGWYISRAIRALGLIPSEEAEPVVPRIVEWLKDPPIASAIASETSELIVKLAHEGGSAAAFSLFRELTAPVPPPAAEDRRRLVRGGEAVCKFEGHWDEDQILSGTLEALKKLDVQQVVAILEDHLCTALRIEAVAMDSPRLEFSSWWRTAIEDTGQDRGRSCKHRLLLALRDALEDWVQQDAVAVKPLLGRYLSDEGEIMRRLGFHILHRFPAKYQLYVAAELQNARNLDTTGIHHEFFVLLQRGYSWLKPPDRQALIAAICGGPPPERVEKWAKWVQEAEMTDVDEHTERYSKQWIRDRLWMLRDHLTGSPKELLNDLVAELGEPEHPSFTRWYTDSFTVRDVSPVTDQEASQLSAEELITFLRGWQPSADQWPGPDRISYEGLARTVAGAVVADPRKYADHLVTMALVNPEYAHALLDPFARGEEPDLLPWEFSIDLCEGLLADDTVRENMSLSIEGSWLGVRQSIVRLLGLGLNNPKHAIPAEYLARVRDVLLVLVDDPDPEPGGDRPQEGWAGYNDPATVALNRVRPSALHVLVEYALFRAQLTEEAAAQDVTTRGPGPKRLETSVRETLTRKLDRGADPSWAVHSVYGRYLTLLYWLDKEWVELHIDQIFPEGTDEQSICYYIAAWDSFVAFNRFYPPMLEMLRSKYERATDNLSKGYVTKTGLGPERRLPLHLAWEYVLSDYELRSPEGQQSLIAMFFKQTSPEARGSGAWVVWRICKDNPSRLETYWPKARSLWEWRTHEASTASHTTDFDEEMTWFAHLLDVAPEWETMASLWPLLEGLLPHIARSERRGMGWVSVEKYLSIEVDRDPVRAIQFYRLMHEQLTRPLQLYRGQEARKIIETAAAGRESRHEALSLIDVIARSGDHQYRDIYDRHAG